jgi:hypothetical protein
MLNLKNLAKPAGAMLQKCRVNKHRINLLYIYDIQVLK